VLGYWYLMPRPSQHRQEVSPAAKGDAEVSRNEVVPALPLLVPSQEKSLEAAPLPSSPLLPLAEATVAWLRGRDNIFFNEDHFIGDLLSKDGEIIAALGARLRDLREVLSLPSREEIVSTTPPVVRERMALLDIIKGILGSNDVDAAKKEALIAEVQGFIQEAIAPSYSAGAKRILLTEKQEALALVARHDPDQAKEILRGVPQARVRELLETKGQERGN
jgi:hypothetical protein